MADVSTLLGRIDPEFSDLTEKIKRAQAEQLHEHQERQKRLAKFEKLLAELSAVWKPRFEALTQGFGDKIEVTPRLTSSSREATMDFESHLARIRLRLSASTDREVRKLVLDYNLAIQPILMQFESHQQAEWPLDAVDNATIADWVDDRIIDFVKTFLSLHENEWYLKDHMVDDPIAGVRSPKFAAAANLTCEGKLYYFISDETQCEFAAKHCIAAK